MEKKAFFVANSIGSANTILGYLLPNPKLGAANSLNPRYLVYKALEFPAQKYAGYALPQDDSAYQNETVYNLSPSPSFSYQPAWQGETKHYSFPLIKPEEFSAPQFVYAQSNLAPNYDMPKPAIEALNGSYWQTTSRFIGVYEPTGAKLGEEKVHRKTLENVIAKTEIHMNVTQSQIPQAPQPTQPSSRYGRGVDFIVNSHFSGKLSLPYETTPKFQIPVLGISLGAILAILNPFRASDYNKTQNNALHNYQKPDITKTVVMASKVQQYILEEIQNGNPENENSGKNTHAQKTTQIVVTEGKTQNSTVIYLSNYRSPRKRNNPFWQPRDIRSKYKAILRDSSRKLREIAKKSSDYALTSAKKVGNQFYANAKSLYTKLKGRIESTIDNYRAGQTIDISESLSARINSYNQLNPNANLESLQDGAKYLEEKSGGKVSYIIIDSVTGEIIAERNADDMVSNGSMSKIFILRQILELSQQGKINLESELKLRNSQHPKNYTPTGKPTTIREACREMVSDENGNSNLVTNALLELIGIKRTNKMLQQQGYNETVFVDYYRPKDLYRGNKTSARDTASEMFRLKNGIGLDEYHHKVALESLDGRYMTYPISKKPQRLNTEKIIIKHGQTEQDISLACGIEGVNNNGETFNSILVYIDSDINKRLVKKDFKTPTSSGSGIMNLFINTLRQACTIAQEYVSYKKPA
ncbi:serine hydrolase [Candidatus Woesearchaeota archaeon]|nr:serine hydrolase [Candidatus Woesearchaeota archaeon]